MPEKDISALVNKYKQAQSTGRTAYFDADEFSDLAEYYDSEDDLDTARDIIEQGLKIHPGNISLLVKKAKLAVYDGEYDKALILLDSLSEYDFDLYLLRIECHLQLEDYAQALILSEELLEKEDNEPLENILAELGFLYTDADYYNEAVLYFEKSLEYNPQNADILSDLMYDYEMLSDFDKAIDVCNRLLDIEPYNFDAWVNLGKYYSLTDEYEKATDAFDFALTINESDSNVLKLKAHCMSLSGREWEAIAIFKSLLSSNPDDTTICFSLAECYQSLEMYDEALVCLNMYQETEGDSDELLAKQAFLLMLKEEYKEGLSIIEKGLLNNPYSIDLNMVGGEIELQTGRYKEAEVYFLSIYSQDKENFQLLDKLAVIQIKEEDYRQAAYYTEKMLELQPGNQAVKQRLALIYFELDDKVKFNEILDQFSDNELLDIFKLIYIPESPSLFDRKMLIFYLNKARETRTLFKNLKY